MEIWHLIDHFSDILECRIRSEFQFVQRMNTTMKALKVNFVKNVILLLMIQIEIIMIGSQPLTDNVFAKFDI